MEWVSSALSQQSTLYYKELFASSDAGKGLQSLSDLWLGGCGGLFGSSSARRSVRGRTGNGLGRYRRSTRAKQTGQRSPRTLALIAQIQDAGEALHAEMNLVI
jgi:hypothetical protein